MEVFTLLNWTPTSDIAYFNANREIGPDYQEFFFNFCRHCNGLGPVAILNYSCNVCCKKIQHFFIFLIGVNLLG
jgi:hypothetical protein